MNKEHRQDLMRGVWGISLTLLGGLLAVMICAIWVNYILAVAFAVAIITFACVPIDALWKFYVAYRHEVDEPQTDTPKEPTAH